MAKWTFEPGHTAAEFRARHMMVTYVRGHFKNVKGNLYDGGFLREITDPLERTSGEGDVRNRADLKALVEAATDSDHQRRLEKLEKTLDLERFLSFSIVEMVTWHWDGYTLKKNNYRIYHDPDSGKMVFFPHGMDQMFWDPNARVVPSRNQAEGLVVRALLETSEGQRRYRARAATLVTNIFTVERLTNQIQQLRARIRPVLAEINPGQARQHDQAVANLLNAVVQRAKRVREILGEPEPEPLRFNSSGEGQLVKWQTFDPRGTGRLERQTDPNGRKLLHIAAAEGGRCTASWRTRVLLPGGRYVFSARIRTAGVVALTKDVNSKGVGAGIRQSQHQVRKHGLIGDNEWQTVEYEFEIPGESGDAALLCELRAEQGEAWFELGSLKVTKK